MADFTERKLADLMVRLDRRTCIGSANCAKVSPMLFQIDDEGIVAFAAGADRVSREEIIEASSVCPVEAIEVKNSSGERIVP